MVVCNQYWSRMLCEVRKMEQKIRRDRNMGDNLRRLRGDAGLSQEKLCAELQRRGCDIGRTSLYIRIKNLAVPLFLPPMATTLCDGRSHPAVSVGLRPSYSESKHLFRTAAPRPVYSFPMLSRTGRQLSENGSPNCFFLINALCTICKGL